MVEKLAKNRLREGLMGKKGNGAKQRVCKRAGLSARQSEPTFPFGIPGEDR